MEQEIKLTTRYVQLIYDLLSTTEEPAKWDNQVLGQLRLLKMDVRFLRAFFLCLETWDYLTIDEESMERLRSMITTFLEIWGKEDEMELLVHRLDRALRERHVTAWHPLASELQGKFRQSKLEIQLRCVNVFHSSFRCKPSTSHQILNVMDSILNNLNDLVSYKSCEIVQFKKQIETLEDKLIFLKTFMNLSANCMDSKELREFNMFVHVFTTDAACLTFIYWANDADDKFACEINSLFLNKLQKIKPTTPDVARLYFGALHAISKQQSDSLMFGQTVFRFVDFFLGDHVTPLKDDFQNFQDDIIFLLTFLNDPPDENREELICSQIDVLFWEGVCGLLPFDGMEGDFSKKKMLLSDFMMKIRTVNADIRQIYCKFPDSSLYDFPKVISPRFLDFLIQKLKNLREMMTSDRKYAPFAKYMIIKIEEELVSLRPFSILFSTCKVN